MLIRCEQCKALFSLQDGVVREGIGEGGTFPVQCGRCESVFEARAPARTGPTSNRVQPPAEFVAGGRRLPPQSSEFRAVPPPLPRPGRAAVDPPPRPPQPSHTAPGSTPEEAIGRATAGPAEAAAPADAQPEVTTPRFVQRSSGRLAAADPAAAPRYAPPRAALDAASSRAPAGRAFTPRAGLGSVLAPADDFERDLARQRQRHKLLLRVTLAGLLLFGAALLLPSLRGRMASLPEAARQKLEEARAKLLPDDAARLEQAGVLLAEAARLAPGEPAVEGERAFATLLLASAHKEQADRLEARGRQLNDQIAQLQQGKAEGWEKLSGSLSDQIAQIAVEREPHVREASRLLQQGFKGAKDVHDTDGEEPAAQRALALYYALSDQASKGARYADKAEKLRPRAAWTAWVRARLELCGEPSSDKLEKGERALAEVRKAEPKLLRALYDLAALDLELQQPGPAREKLAELLAANPAHERAKKLQTALQTTPQTALPAASQAPVPAQARPTR